MIQMNNFAILSLVYLMFLCSVFGHKHEEIYNEKKTLPAFKFLVDGLIIASQLELTLLNAYLVAASSIKSTPNEFEYLPDINDPTVLHLNPRRAIQYELARSWKTDILLVAHEEMLHLHFVNCLLRSIGEPPSFKLPTLTDKGWQIPDWVPQIGGDSKESNYVSVPVDKFSLETVKNFVLFESTDSLQDELFSIEFNKNLIKLREWETKYRVGEILGKRDAVLEKKIYDIYAGNEDTLRTIYEGNDTCFASDSESKALTRFRSIADFYLKYLRPLFQEAFDLKLVTHKNRDLNNELQNGTVIDSSGVDQDDNNVAIGPTYHSNNFAAKNYKNPIKNFKDVNSIIQEIVQQGEGFSNYTVLFNELLTKDPVDYALLSTDFKSKDNLRLSHLYKFMKILSQLTIEEKFSAQSNMKFDAARSYVIADSNYNIIQIQNEISSIYNSLNLVVVVWLSRIYEIPHWLGDASRRNAIEQLVAWPLMSIGVRPLLELATFFDSSIVRNLFSQDFDSLPYAPSYARELHIIYYDFTNRSESVNKHMDYLAVRVLSEVANWASEKIPIVRQYISDERTRFSMIAKLKSLTVLKEFKKQFKFREEGSYSDTLSDKSLRKDDDKYEENPTNILYNNTFLLRLRYAGYGTYQLAADPDPNTDEVGVTGPLKIHAADKFLFNRTLYIQKDEGIILRNTIKSKHFCQNNLANSNKRCEKVIKGMPEAGVYVVDATLQFTKESVSSYSSIGNAKSSGAVQVTGSQSDFAISNIFDLIKVDNATTIAGNKILINFEKDSTGLRTRGISENHLVYKDGEPYDPYIKSISVGKNDLNNITRSIYGPTVLDMSPAQRAKSYRSPTGFLQLPGPPKPIPVPTWAFAEFSDDSRKQVSPDSNFFNKQGYLSNRVSTLFNESSIICFKEKLINQIDIDECVSLLERIRDYNTPALKVTSQGWLDLWLKYAHTVSGDYLSVGSNNAILDYFSKAIGLKFSVSSITDRSKQNSRWLDTYAFGQMDTDGLTHYIYGELYIPLSVISQDGKSVNFEKKWYFPGVQFSYISSYTSDFCKCFWISNNNCCDPKDKSKRSFTTGYGTVVETKKSFTNKQNSSEYTYDLLLDNNQNFVYKGTFLTTQDNNSNQVIFTWLVSLNCVKLCDPNTFVTYTSLSVSARQGMNTFFQNLFTLNPDL